MLHKHTRIPTAQRKRALRPVIGGTAIALGSLLAMPPPHAAAEDFALHIEPAAALWLTTPQSDRFRPGVYGAIRPSLALGPFAALQLSYAFLFAAADDEANNAGTAHLLTAGVRVRPFAMWQPETEQLGGFWADLNAGYARTGELDRFTFDAGLGYGFQVTPQFALGPALRYLQIVQPNDRDGFDGHDARALMFGANFSFGPAKAPAEVAEPIVYATEPSPVYIHQECVEQTCPQLASNSCIDSDNDGICDDVDRCPYQRGPLRTQGCPINPCDGAPLRMLVQFEFDSASMPVVRSDEMEPMDPVLDAVANAIALDPTCRVGIMGHASEEGDADHNQQLSVARATAVQRYMVERGVAANRIPVGGMGDQCQLVPERSRVLNRRVEFFRLDEGDAMPTQCLP